MIMRYAIGAMFTFCAGALLFLHQPVWALWPAVIGVYILGSTLWDMIR